MSLVPQYRIDMYIEKYRECKKPELRSMLKELNKKSKTSEVICQIKAITALLS